MEDKYKQEQETLDKRFDELMAFLAENMATKQDIADIRGEMATKQDIADVRVDMATKDDLELVRDDLMGEIRSVRNDVSSLRTEVHDFEERITADINAFAEDIVDLRKRVFVLERKCGHCQPA